MSRKENLFFVVVVVVVVFYFLKFGSEKFKMDLQVLQRRGHIVVNNLVVNNCPTTVLVLFGLFE